MYEKQTSSGYNLYQPFPDLDQWVISLDDSQAYHGSLTEVIKYMIQKLSFSFEDIEDGVNLLIDNPMHNLVHFGYFRTVLFTSKKEVEYEKAS